ncbi:MAG: hypothetical protein OEU84_17915 [Xanthomonadales bacterium]|nr:hypothetical protein [Xanthomonadales bacterium]
MRRMTRILSLGLLLSISTVALAGKGNDRNGHDGYYRDAGGHHHSARHYDRGYRHHNNRYDRRHYSKHHRHGKRHYAHNKHRIRRHSRHNHHCYDWYPCGYVPPHVRYRYIGPGLVIDYRSGAGLHIGGG